MRPVTKRDRFVRLSCADSTGFLALPWCARVLYPLVLRALDVSGYMKIPGQRQCTTTADAASHLYELLIIPPKLARLGLEALLHAQWLKLDSVTGQLFDPVYVQVQHADSGEKQQAEGREGGEVAWRVQRCWEAYLKQRTNFFRNRHGRGPRGRRPKLSGTARSAIAESIRTHDADLLGSLQREDWSRYSIARGALIGIWLSPWHTGQNPNEQMYVEPERAVRALRGKVDPAPGFADLYYKTKGESVDVM